jgi:hypothetical protein
MHFAKARSHLNELLVALKSWEGVVAARATQFHRNRLNLMRHLGEVLPFWKLWIGDEAVAHARERVEGLREVVEPLSQLLREMTVLESDVHRLRTRGEGRDAEFAEWLQARCRDFVIRIGRLATRCESEIDVNRDRELLAKIEAEVRFHHEGVSQLAEAERVLNFLSPLRAATLAAQLPLMRNRLYKDGFTPDWLRDLHALVQPLQKEIERIEDPPPQINALSATLTELGRWSTRLGGEFRQDVEQLEEKLGFNVVDWEPATFQAIDEEVQRLRTKILDRVVEMRGAKLDKLEREMADLRLASTYDENLESQLAVLRERPFQRPHLFDAWLEEHKRFHNSFRAIAQANIGRLTAHLSKTILDIDAQLEALDSKPLSLDSSNEVVLVRDERRSLWMATDVEEILRQLRRANDISQKIDRLHERAEQELHEIARRKKDLSERMDVLQTAIKSAKGVTIETGDLTTEIASLSEGEGALEERRQQAQRLESELAALETQFADACRAQLAVLLFDSTRAAEVLRRAGAPPRAFEAPAIDAAATPEQTARAVLEAWHLSRALRKAARLLFKQLDQRRLEAHAELNALHADDLTPGDREERSHLRRDLDAGSWTEPRALMDRLERLAAIVERCNRFFDGLEQEQRAARERREQLERHFRRFTNEQLYPYCPALADRVAALIFGVREQAHSWTAIRNQLDVAGDLFARVDPHAQRLAADELDHAAAILRERLRDGGDPSFRDLAKDLLRELDVCSPEILPPASLRSRIVTASRRQA